MISPPSVTERSKRELQSGDLTYRPAIDGLRAFAVISVVIFHLDPRLLSGGFLGVDIFFVLSGYLITRIICRDLVLGKFSFAKFYQRRIARIFPAYFLVAISTIIAAYFLYSSQDFASAGSSLIAATLCVANIKFILQGNYFEVVHDAQPYLHYWTLAVEEQFYIIYPVLLFLLNRKKMRLRLSVLISLVILLVSFFACIWLTPRHNEVAFFSLPTRAWELMAGCILALYSFRNRNHASTPSTSWLFPAAGMVMVLSSFFFIEQSADIPGFLTAIPVVGAVFIIGLNWNQNQWVESVLRWKVFVKIGKLSYSLYLWHWPVFSFVDYHYYDMPESFRMSGKLIIAIVLSILSYQLIERRSRRAINQFSKPYYIFASVALFASVVVFSAYQIRKNYYIDVDLKTAQAGGLEFGDPSDPAVLLFGNSMAAMYGKLFSDLPNQCDIRTIIVGGAGQHVFPAIGDNSYQDDYWRAALSTIKKQKPEIVFIAVAYTSIEQIKAAFEQVLNELSQIKNSSSQPLRIVLLGGHPYLSVKNVREHFQHNSKEPIGEPEETRMERERAMDYLQSITNDRIVVLDVSKFFIDSEGNTIYADKHGRLLYHDNVHLSHRGSLRVQEAIIKEIDTTLKGTSTNLK